MFMESDEYSSETGVASENEWYSYLEQFDDANLYQTISYGKNSKGGRHLTHFILRKGNKVVAIAQLRLFLIPVIKKGIAYLLRGPVWKLKNEDENLEILDRMLKALYNEFIIKRKLVLIVGPNLYEEEGKDYESVFIRNNFKLKKLANKRRTILIDLSRSKEELRKKLRRSWRQNLTKAESNGHILEREGRNNFSILNEIHGEVVRRKAFRTDLTVDNFSKIQNDLPDNYKLDIMLCKSHEEYVSGLIGVNIGDTGLALIGGTTAAGLRHAPNSYYLLMWNMCESARAAGCRWFDLGGINPDTNPGCYQFKSGMRGREVTYLSNYQASKIGISCMVCRLLDLFLWVCNKLRR